MTKKEEIQAVLDLFSMPGWAFIVEDIDNMKKGFDNVGNLDTLLELGRRQGRVEQLDFFTRLQDWYNSALSELERQDDETSI